MAAFYGTRVVLVPLTLTVLEQRGHGAARFARYRVCSPLGFTVTAIGGGLLLGHLSFGLLFSAGAALYLALGLSGLALPLGTVRPDSPAVPAAGPAEVLYPRRVLGTLALMALLYGLASSCADTYVPLLMRQVHGSFLQVGLAGTVVTGVEVPLMLFFGRLAERGYQASLLALGMALLPLRFALYVVVQEPLQLLAVQLLDGPTFAAFAIIGVALLSAQTPPQERAWALSVYAAAGTAGPVLGPLLAGLAASQVGLQPMFGLVALGTIGVPVLVVAGLWPLLRPRPATGTAAP
jgi:predicted MFS family arabinose efflux permease